MKLIEPQRKSEIAVLLLMRAMIYGSILALFFIFSYSLFDLLDIGKNKSNLIDKPVEDIVAAFGNDGSAEFARGSGMLASPSIVGAVDLVRRNPNGRLQLEGWAVDKSDPKRPIRVFMVIPKKAVLATNTGKRRDDIAGALQLPADTLAAGFSDIFDYQFDCRSNGLDPFILAINQKKQFSLIAPRLHVGGC